MYKQYKKDHKFAISVTWKSPLNITASAVLAENSPKRNSELWVEV